MYQFDIGDARSLPWGAGETQGLAGYELTKLMSDTDELLTPHTPAIVRLETLRRAVLYASRDRKVADRPFERFDERARWHIRKAAHPDPMIVLDAAFVTDLLWQLGQHSNPPFTEHVQAARAGADRDVLLARNLGRIYADRVSDLRRPTDSSCPTSSVVKDTAPADRNAGAAGPGEWFVNSDRTIWAEPLPDGGWPSGGTLFSGNRTINGQKTMGSSGGRSQLKLHNEDGRQQVLEP